jgi:hypothetical protein
LHLNIRSERQPVPDVPVIYFIEPTDENVSRLVADFKEGLYSYMHINFVSSIPRALLQKLAKDLAAVGSNSKTQISKVVDRYCSFVSLDQTTYTLNNQSTYLSLHKSGASDNEIEKGMEKVANGVLSVILTALKQVPVIRAASNGAAGMVAQILNEKLVDLLKAGGSTEIFSSTSAVSADPSHAQRPLLVILDRDLDLSPMVSHGWSYAGLAADLFGMSLNKLTIPKENKHYDIDPSESFWRNSAHLPFPDAATAVNELVSDFSRLRGEMTSGEGGLTSAVSALPQVTEMKKTVDMHTTIATSLLNEVKARQIDKFYELERDLNPTLLNQLLTDPSAQLVDKVRSAIVFLLRKDGLPPAKIDQIMSQLNQAVPPGSDGSLIGAVKYIKYLLSLRQVPASSPVPTGAPQVVLPGMLGGIAEKMKTRGEGLLAAGIKNLKNILPINDNLVITNTVQQLSDQIVNPLTDSFLYFDPRNPQSSVRVRGSFRQVVVCVVGGGSVTEGENMNAWATKTGRTVIYGATDFPSPSAFVQDLAKLASA